jgi:PAS domain S-box-containing protein
MKDLLQDTNFPRQTVAVKSGLSAGFAFPVTDRGAVLGVIEFFTDRHFELDADATELLQTLGRQIGRLIAYKKVESERERLASVVEYSSDAIFTTSADDMITSWNRGAERLFGYEAAEANGKKAAMLIPLHREDEFYSLRARVKRGERIDNHETEYVKQEGKFVDVSISWAPLLDESGNDVGCSLTVRDITERKDAEKRVSEFYSVVSHELRTPLTSIRGALGLIEGNVLDAEEITEMVAAARGSADRLIRLINDMLDLKKVESGKMDLQRTKIDVSELVSQSLYALTGMAEEAGVKLMFSEQSSGVVYADWDKATQIITNLVSNAIKFSLRDTEVSVVTELMEEKTIRFQIIDHGSGIAADDIGKLFEKFKQLDSSDTRHKGGTGLGLAITKALVEQHGGTIGVESKPGKGSRFWFELPVFIEKADSQQVPNDAAVLRDPGKEILTVLLVEEDEELGASLGSFIENQGYQVVRARTVSEAKGCVTEMIPNAVVYDLTLKDGTVLELVAALRASKETADVPVIVMAGQQKEERLFGNAMIVDWLCKPFDGQMLVSAIDRVLGISRGCKVLVVDDDADTRRVITAQLKAVGLRCIEAKDGGEAIYFARSESPDLIVLDVHMPKLDAFGVIEVLSKEESKATPLLIYTCRDLSESDREMLTLGISRYLIKSTSSPLELVQVVQELLGGVSSAVVRRQTNKMSKMAVGVVDKLGNEVGVKTG